MDKQQKSLKELNELLTELVGLENELANKKETLERWKKLDFALTNGNWSLMTTLEDLKIENDNLSDKVAKMTNKLEDGASNIESIENNQDTNIEEIWKNFTEVSSYYRNLIKSAQEEYKKGNLLADIKHSNELLEEINKKNDNIIKDMENLTAKFGLLESGTNIAAKRLDEIKQFTNSLDKDQLSIKTIIKAHEDKLRNNTLEIKNKEREMMNLSSKKKK